MPQPLLTVRLSLVIIFSALLPLSDGQIGAEKKQKNPTTYYMWTDGPPGGRWCHLERGAAPKQTMENLIIFLINDIIRSQTREVRQEH